MLSLRVYLSGKQDVIIVCIFTSNTRRYHYVFIYQYHKTLSFNVYLPVTQDVIIVCLFTSIIYDVSTIISIVLIYDKIILTH